MAFQSGLSNWVDSLEDWEDTFGRQEIQSPLLDLFIWGACGKYKWRHKSGAQEKAKAEDTNLGVIHI